MVFRTSAVDELKALYRPVDDEVAKAIDDGDIPAMRVVNAIMKAERYSDSFDWDEFKKQESMLNMRKSGVDLADEETVEKLPDDAPGTVLSLDSIAATEPVRRRRRAVEPEKNAADAKSE